MTPTSPRDGESVKGKRYPKCICGHGHWNMESGCSCCACKMFQMAPAQPPEKVAADEEEVMRPLRLHEFMASHAQSFLYVTELESSLASSAARVEELEKQAKWVVDHVQEFGKSANLPVVVSRLSRVLERELAKSKEVK